VRWLASFAVFARPYDGRVMAVQPHRRASRRFDIRVEPVDLADIRRLAQLHRLPVSRFVVECALGRLQLGRDRIGELERRLELVESQLARAQRGY